MDIANEMANYLADAGYGTLGTDIYVGQIPSGINGIFVERFGGSLNNYIPVEETVLDIFVKNSSGSEAIATTENIKRFIHRMHNTTTANSYIYSMLVIGDVEDLERDSEHEKLYKITVLVTHRSTGLIS